MKPETQLFNVRLPKELWKYLRKTAFDQNISMNEVVVRWLKKFKDDREKMLT